LEYNCNKLVKKFATCLKIFAGNGKIFIINDYEFFKIINDKKGYFVLKDGDEHYKIKFIIGKKVSFECSKKGFEEVLKKHCKNFN